MKANAHKIYQLNNAKYFLKFRNKCATTNAITYSQKIVKKYNVQLVGFEDNKIHNSGIIPIKALFGKPLKYSPQLLEEYLDALSEMYL